MVQFPEGPCVPWATFNEACCPGVDISDPDAAALLAEQATWLLWALSGRKYSGPCAATAHVCMPCACLKAECCCAFGDRIDLGEYWPVTSISEVRIDGAVFTGWSLFEHRWLTRTDGGRWPRCGGMIEPLIEADLVFGREPNAAARAAARTLLCELAKACWSPSKCRLPQRMSSMTREGVTYAFLDPMEMLNNGRTGLYEVDLWLAAEKMAGQARPGLVDPTEHRNVRLS